MSSDHEVTTTLVLDPTAFLRALKRVVVRLLALQEALQGQIIKDDSLRRNFASAVLRLYENEEALLVSLLHNAIGQAIRIPESESLMLREGSLMVDFLSEFAKQAIAPQRSRMLPLVQKLVKENVPMEVDPARLGISLSPRQGSEVPPALQAGRDNLAHCATTFLSTIVASVDAAPRALKKVIRIVYESAEARFPGSGFRTLGGVLFLRLFCPSIVAPEAHNLSSSPVPPAARRSLILVAKLLQSLVNESSFEKEEYMLCFTPWVEEHVATIRSAFLTWVHQGGKRQQHEHESSSGTSPANSPRSCSGSFIESSPEWRLSTSELRLSTSEWRLSTSSLSSSESSSSLDQGSCVDAMDEATVTAIEQGLKESMKVLRAYNDDLAVMNAIKSLDLRYKDVKHSMRAIFASTSSATSTTTVHARASSSGSAIPTRASLKALTRSSRQRSISDEQLDEASEDKSAKKGSLINRLTGSNRRSGSRISKDATDDPTSTDVVRWDRKLVLAWLRSLEIEEDSIKEYRRGFKKNNVTGLKLQQFTRESLVDIGVKRIGDRKKIINSAQQMFRERLALVQVKGVEDWTTEDVAVWLGANELNEYQEQWLKDSVNGQVLLEAMNFDNGMQRLNVAKCGHRKKLIRLLRETSSSSRFSD